MASDSGNGGMNYFNRRAAQRIALVSVILAALAAPVAWYIATESAEHESFASGGLEHPHYAKPREFEGMSVPTVLLGGDHAAITRWREAEAVKKTRQRRPDLLGPEVEPPSPAKKSARALKKS